MTGNSCSSRVTAHIVSDSAENRVVLAANYAEFKERKVRSCSLTLRVASRHDALDANRCGLGESFCQFLAKARWNAGKDVA